MSAQVYRLPLDDLIGNPETGDPRIRLRPRRVNGRTIVPLTHQPGDRHAWKIIVPRTTTVPTLSTHPGSAWIYIFGGDGTLAAQHLNEALDDTTRLA